MSLKDLCPRLIDYFVIVGCQNPNRSHILNQQPDLLRRYPRTDHLDFALPKDLVYFCQPEGCINTTPTEFLSSNTFADSLHTQNSFIFSLTDKDKSKTRFGICVNFIRPIIRRRKSTTPTSIDKDDLSNRKKPEDFSATSSTSSTDLYNRSRKRPRTHSLTSLCIISHHPFYTKFRNCLLIFLTILQKTHEHLKDKQREVNIWSLLTGLSPKDPGVPGQLSAAFREIEIWIYKLMSLPVPVPGKTVVNVQVQPEETITFALPDEKRLPLVDFYLHLPFQLLGIEKAMKTITFLLLEKKVLIVSKNYCDLTVTIMSLITLIYPIQYMFPVIPLLPTSMPDGRQILSAPSPFLIGVPDSFLKANVNIPSDIIIVDLDRAELKYSINIPNVPTNEMNYIKENVRQSLENLTPMLNDRCSNSHNESFTFSSDASVNNDNLDWLIQSSDEDSINVTTRVVMIHFFNSMNILGKFSDHTRTLRLYPRPVVTIHIESFLQSRPMKSSFIKELMKTQGVEYLAEWLTVPDNLAFNRIIEGLNHPKDIGDNFRWFKNSLNQINCLLWSVGENDQFLKLSLDVLNDTFNLVSRKAYIGRKHIKNTLPSPDVKLIPGEMVDEPTDESCSDTEPGTESDISTASEFALDYSIGNDKVDETIVEEANPELVSIDEDLCARFYHRNDIHIIDTNHLPQHIILSRTPSYSDVQSFVKFKSPQSNEHLPIKRKNSHSKERITNSPIPQARMKSESLTKQTLKRKSMENILSAYNRPKSLITSFEAPSLVPSIETNSIHTNHSSSGIFLDKIFDSHESNLETIKNEIEDRGFLDTVLKEVETGNTLSFFSGKSRFKTLMEEESSRNYIMSKIDKNLSSKSNGSTDQQRVANYEIASWNKYKSMEWLLTILMQGIGNNFSSRRSQSNSDFNWLGKEQRVCVGGLSSAYVVLEVAYTYFVTIVNKTSGGWNKQKSQSSTPKLHDSTKASLEEKDANDKIKSAIASLVDILDIGKVTRRPKTPCESQTKSMINFGPSLDSQTDENPPINPKLTKSSVPWSNWLEKSFWQESEKKIVDYFKDSTKYVNDILDYSSKVLSEFDPEVTNVDSTDQNLAKSTSINDEEYEVVDMTSDPVNKDERGKIFLKLTDSNPDYDFVDIDGHGRFPYRKSTLSKGYRYCNGTLLRTDPRLGKTGEVEKSLLQSQLSFNSSPMSVRSVNSSKPRNEPKPEKTSVPWTYIYEDLILNSANMEIFQDMQFWEEVFVDAVSQERDILGLDQNPKDLIEHYETLTELEKKNLELKEDKVLVYLMHNIVGFMVMTGLSNDKIKRKIRRLIAKSHTGLHYSQEINNLLDSLEFLGGNDIDLRPMLSRTSLSESHKVRNKNDPYKEDNFLELSDDCLLLRNIYGNIIDRWWYNRLTYVTYKPPLLCISRRIKDKTDMVTFITQDRSLYDKIKTAIEKSTEKNNDKKFGVGFGEKINVIDQETGNRGTIEVNPKGFDFTFGMDKFTISLIHIDSCSICDKNVFVMKAIHPVTKKIMIRKYETDFALHLLNQWHRSISHAMVRKNPFRSVISNPQNSCKNTPRKILPVQRTLSHLIS